jgi:long-chain acyl-CoA synthetase
MTRALLAGVLALCSLMPAWEAPASAATVAGVTLPDTIAVDGTTLTLNGMGLREVTFMRIDAYVGALYLQQRTRDAAVVIDSAQLKHVTMVFLRRISGGRLESGWADSLRRVAPGEGPAIDRFVELVPDVANRDRIDFTLRPGRGVEILYNGTVRGTIEGDAFARALLTVWFGPDADDADLKRAMLGG